jgi:Protein of unknown function (DUF2950)
MVTIHMNPLNLMTRLGNLALVLLLALPLSSFAADQKTFATPEAAADALQAALKANDEAALITLFGEKHRGLIGTGDPAWDAEVRASRAAQMQAYRLLSERGADRRVLLMGTQAWPFPIPLVREAGAWRFATEQGAEELINRRIGANERNAIRVMRAYLDAQRQFAAHDRDGDGVLQYARKMASSPGKHDGLYWAADESKGEEASPFGPLLALDDKYMSARRKGDPYQGYHFRILTRQGANAPGGPYSYVINGRMVAGFAMVAFPDSYGDSGVMTFIVSHNGKVYEKDLGKNTSSLGARMVAFDPGPGWKQVEP